MIVPALELLSECGAAFSPCRRYRYALWRRWMPGPAALFIGLNPSTADETVNDPTIRRCIRFAMDWGCGTLLMANLFAFRATDPRVMRQEPEPVGPENDRCLIQLYGDAGCAIAAWGTNGPHLGRDREVMLLLPRLLCLGTTKAGHPKHPLYLSSTTARSPFSGTGI